MGLHRDAQDGEVWLHGTKAAPFHSWIVPPPRDPRSLLAEHSALFFTLHEDYAAGVGGRVCETRLSASAKVLVPELRTEDGEDLRVRLLAQPAIGKCHWLRDRSTWSESWRTGEVMRFGAVDAALNQALVRNAARLVQMKAKGLSPTQVDWLAKQNITRGWIEAIIAAAREMGFDALRGQEIDRHSGTVQAVARPWLAVWNAGVVAPPVWR